MPNLYSIDDLRLLSTPILLSLKKINNINKSKVFSKVTSARKRYFRLKGIKMSDLGGSTGNVAVPSMMSSEDINIGSDVVVKPVNQEIQVIQSIKDTGENVYTNISPSTSSIDTVISKMTSEVENSSFINNLKVERVGSELSELETRIASLAQEMSIYKSNIEQIDLILEKRELGTEVQPELNLSALGPANTLADEYTILVDKTIIGPYIEDLNKFFSQIGLDTSGLPSTTLFDLVYGPPISRKGQFILSEDGLYYDSRASGLPSVTGVIDSSAQLGFGFPPNLGGKGIIYTRKNADELTNTIFDLDNIPDTLEVQKYFDTDRVLQRFIEDKTIHLYDLSGEISELIASGYSPSGATVVNHYLNINSIIELYDQKIKRRKKQLHLAYLSGKFKIIKNKIYELSGTVSSEITNIPINNLSFLRGTGIDPTLQEQMDVFLALGDVKDSVLPIKPLFLVSHPSKSGSVFSNITLSRTGIGDFVHTEDKGVTSITPFVKSLTDDISLDKLVVGYTFLNPNVVTPSSTEFLTKNLKGGSNSCQLVASSTLWAYPSGLSIPKLMGCDYDQGGSYIKLPEITELTDLFYEKDGFTISFWTYLPPLAGVGTTFAADHKHRLVLANENSGNGGQTYYSNKVTARHKNLDLKTRGLVLGFEVNALLKTQFFLRPTVSQNENKGLWGHSVAFLESSGGDRLGFSCSTNSVSSVSAGFYQFTLTGNNKTDSLALYVDGSLVATSSISTVFGTNPPSIPTYINTTDVNLSSFEWSPNTGPKLQSKFTPFVLGGGYTDGTTSGFMGTNTNHDYYPLTQIAGTRPLKSGLEGFLGLFLIYSRPLNTTEVTKLYSRTQDFYKNISI